MKILDWGGSRVKEVFFGVFVFKIWALMKFENWVSYKFVGGSFEIGAVN